MTELTVTCAIAGMGECDSPATWSHPELLEQVIKDRNNGINISDHGDLNSEHQGSEIWIMNNTIKREDGHLTIHLVHAYATTEDHSSNIHMKWSNAMLITVCVHDSTNQQPSTVDNVQSVSCILYIIFWKISFTLTFSGSVITIMALCNSNYFLSCGMGLTQSHMNINVTL